MPRVEPKELRNFRLIVCQVLSERRARGPAGLLQLDKHQRQAVDEPDQIRPAGVRSLSENYERFCFQGKVRMAKREERTYVSLERVKGIEPSFQCTFSKLLITNAGAF